MLCDQFGIEQKQVNAILECLHVVLGNMLCTSGFEGKDNLYHIDTKEFITISTGAAYSNMHEILGYSPGAVYLVKNCCSISHTRQTGSNKAKCHWEPGVNYQ